MARPTRFGASEPLQGYQDNFIENMTPMISHAPMPSATKPGRRPLSSSNANVVLKPPSASSLKRSPFKSTTRPSTSPLIPLKKSQNIKLNMVSFVPPSNQEPSTDSMQKPPLMSRFKTVAQKPPPENRASFPGKEILHQKIFPAAPTFSLSIENYYQKPVGKRVLLEAPSIQEARPDKNFRSDEPLPAHDTFPPIMDDGTKPGHSYAMLIGMAILRAPNRRLTLSQIYKWISDTYSFYSVQDAGWQNSIRHNLSLNKAFIKQERPKDDPGKGNYWMIETGMEHLFMKDRPIRKATSTGENLPVMSTRLEPSQPLVAPPLEPALPPQLPLLQPALPTFPTSQPPGPPQPELSSDATIPVSDNAAPEEVPEKSIEHELSLDSGLYSPGPAVMQSSPPIPRHVDAPSGTPPRPPRMERSSATRSHKRKFASMDDSGYISSLDSSVVRPNQKAGLLTSEADRPRIKRARAGRAEEEIARLRASSYDSPSKGRSWNGFAPQSSSPLRQSNDARRMLPPLTPAVKLKAVPKPPPSVSPNTNLRIHRTKIQHMLQSPLRRMTNFQVENDPWSPAFRLEDNVYSLTDFSMENGHGGLDSPFDIFQDSTFDAFYPSVENGSPEKRSVKRLRPDKGLSAGVLGDITNSASHRSITSAPLLKPGRSPDPAMETPSKVFSNFQSPTKLFAQQSPSKLPTMDDQNVSPWITVDEFCSPDFFSGEVSIDLTSMDMLQGFQKIGSASQSSRPSRVYGKPPLGRSNTSGF